MENCSLPNGALLSGSKAGGEEARLDGVEQRLGGVEQISGSSCADWIQVPPIRLGGGFSSNVQSNLVRLSSSAAGEQQMQMAGILGGWCPAVNNKHDHPLMVQVQQELSGACQWYHTLLYRRLWMWLTSPFHGDNSISFYHIFIVVAKFDLIKQAHESKLMGSTQDQLGGNGLASMDGWTLPIWRSMALVPTKLGTSDVARLRQKGLGGKDVEVDLIPKKVPFDGDRAEEQIPGGLPTFFLTIGWHFFSSFFFQLACSALLFFPLHRTKPPSCQQPSLEEKPKIPDLLLPSPSFCRWLLLWVVGSVFCRESSAEITAGSSPNCSLVVLGKFWFLIIGCPSTWIESLVYGVNFLCYVI
ncbi:hypothetical protein SLEP1_g27703 [Rubroshorea leprosula]|uniref:Uncharacterized protein n=1 Tax=Rubroshorea leprosula TaxID=152421 RepID=A0AAV5K0K0_9ROSI|nr:hypothetical protein SLEP1_g27703 [Rubroshorea leprosula]